MSMDLERKSGTMSLRTKAIVANISMLFGFGVCLFRYPAFIVGIAAVARFSTINDFVARRQRHELHNQTDRTFGTKKSIVEARKQLVTNFAPWAVASLLLYLLSLVDHLRLVQTAAFLALFLSVLFFILGHRALKSGEKVPTKYGVRICAWTTILACALYLFFSS